MASKGPEGMVSRFMQLALDLFEPAPQRPPAPCAETLLDDFKPNRPDVGVFAASNAIILGLNADEPHAVPQLAAPVAAPPSVRPVAPPQSVRPAVPPPPVRPASPVLSAELAPAPSPSLLSACEFRHPQANRQLLLGPQVVVAYLLQRGRRRTIGFTVGPDGLAVRAPSWVTLAAVDDALREKSTWILSKLQQARERQARTEGGRIHWADGAVLPYLGAPLTVVLDPTQGFAGKGGQLVEDEAGQRSLRIGLSRRAEPAQIRDAVQAWLLRDARRYFTARLDHFAPLLGVRWSSLRLSNAQTRWGSAKADGSIRLNWRLLHYSPATIDYVVAHELAHLRVMDHSPQFWSTVETVVPDYKARRQDLQAQPAPLW